MAKPKKLVPFPDQIFVVRDPDDAGKDGCLLATDSVGQIDAPEGGRVAVYRLVEVKLLRRALSSSPDGE